MTATLASNTIQDATAISIALAVAAANSKAAELGYDLGRMTIRITQDVVEEIRTWRVYYRPAEHINMRGGDVDIWVNTEDNSIVRVMRGQ